MDFSAQDLALFEKKGISKQQIEKQIRQFNHGFPFVTLYAPAIPGHGIKVYEEGETDKYIRLFENHINGKKLVKFVPASGAATRMFKHLYELLESESEESMLMKLERDQSFNSAFHFLNNLNQFAFHEHLSAILEKSELSVEELIRKKDYKTILHHILFEQGMNYGSLPKGLLRFHRYSDGNRLALEEHMVEGAFYARNDNNKVYLHFTVSPEHIDAFRETAGRLKLRYEKQFGVEYHIDFSTQKESTDTLAVDINNQPFRDRNGEIVFRPGGHGALIENLNSIHADIIFIKNIDNIVPDRLKPETYRYKKLLAGILLEIQEKVFEHLRRIDKGQFNEHDIEDIKSFMENELMIHFPEDFNDLDIGKQFTYIEGKLNRPIRICGMVKNEGEPGGGPFWVINDKGEKTLQIVEASQIDSANPLQMDVLRASTHFNPVDIVCATNNFQGKHFNLRNYIDSNTGFISYKSKDGKELKALELPGLWNGAMADWNTIFVEVPIITFNPVKTINDLLREQHV